MEQTLKLNEFRTLYRYYRRYIGWFDHLLLGVLVWIESKVVITRTHNTVDQAINEYLTSTTQEPPKPVYTEIPATTEDSTAAQLLGVSEMRLTALHVTEPGGKGGVLNFDINLSSLISPVGLVFPPSAPLLRSRTHSGGSN